MSVSKIDNNSGINIKSTYYGRCDVQKWLAISVLALSVIVFALGYKTPLFGTFRKIVLITAMSVGGASGVLFVARVLWTCCCQAEKKAAAPQQKPPAPPLDTATPPATTPLAKTPANPAAAATPTPKRAVSLTALPIHLFVGSSWDLAAMQDEVYAVEPPNASFTHRKPKAFCPIGPQLYYSSLQSLDGLVAGRPLSKWNYQESYAFVQKFGLLSDPWKLRNAILSCCYFGTIAQRQDMKKLFDEHVFPILRGNLNKTKQYLSKYGGCIGQLIQTSLTTRANLQLIGNPKLGQIVALKERGKYVWAMVVAKLEENQYLVLKGTQAYKKVLASAIFKIPGKDLPKEAPADVEALLPENYILKLNFEQCMQQTSDTLQDSDFVTAPFPIYWGTPGDESRNGNALGLGNEITCAVVPAEYVETVRKWMAKRNLEVYVISVEELIKQKPATTPARPVPKPASAATPRSSTRPMARSQGGRPPQTAAPPKGATARPAVPKAKVKSKKED